MINVWGDSTVTAIVAHLSRREVAEMERQGVPDLDELHIPGHAPIPSGKNKKKAAAIEEKSNEIIGSAVEPAFNVKASPDFQLRQNSYPEFIDKGSQYQIKF